MTANFIKKIFRNSADNSVHSQFIRFGKGKFENKAVSKISRNGKIRIRGSFEMVNDLVLFAFSILKKAKTGGFILLKESSREDVESIIGEKSVKKRGSWIIEVNREFSYEEIEKIRDLAFYLLIDIDSNGISFSTKKNLPKSSKSAGKIDDKFCSMQLDNKHWPQVKEEFLFDAPEGKRFELSHTYVIDEIIFPKDEKDYEKIRLMSKRKGKILRKVIIDGKEYKTEKDFTA